LGGGRKHIYTRLYNGGQLKISKSPKFLAVAEMGCASPRTDAAVLRPAASVRT
jgi:hypothetical protein